MVRGTQFVNNVDGVYPETDVLHEGIGALSKLLGRAG